MDLLWSSSTNGSKSSTAPRNLDLLSSGSDQAPVGCLQKLDFDLKDRRGVESTFAFFFDWIWVLFFCLSFFWLLKFAWIFYIAFFCGLKLEDVIGNMKSDIRHQNLIEGNGPCRPGPKFQTKLLWGERGGGETHHLVHLQEICLGNSLKDEIGRKCVF